MPKISVIMSVYNGERHLKEAIDSILKQTYNDFEFIIINDGSTDGTAQIFAEFQDQRLRILHQKNMGLPKSLNKAINLAQGKYIARMDADDIALPQRLEKQVRFLEENPSIAVLGSMCNEIDWRGNVTPCPVYPLTDAEIRKEIVKRNPFIHSSVIMRREIFNIVGLYNEDCRYSQDYELWFRVIKHFKVANLPEILIMRRLHKSALVNMKRLGYDIKARLQGIRHGQSLFYSCFGMVKSFLYITIIMPGRSLARKYLNAKF